MGQAATGGEADSQSLRPTPPPPLQNGHACVSAVKERRWERRKAEVESEEITVGKERGCGDSGTLCALLSYCWLGPEWASYVDDFPYSDFLFLL